MPRSAFLFATLAAAAFLAASAWAADPPPIDPIATDEAAAAYGRRARTLVTVDADGTLRAATRGNATGTAEPPIKAEDPAVRAVLAMLGLERARRFAIVGVQNPKCVKICELVGGDYFCRKVCN